MDYLLLGLFGCMAGVTTVLFGFGGGFVVVPVLYRLLGAQEPALHIAVATSTCVMVVNAAIATGKQWRAGNLLPAYLWPLAGFIGVGAIVGALAAGRVNNLTLRLGFVVYLGATIADCVLRRGFIQPSAQGAARPLAGGTHAVGGIVMGAIATFLGVGGSVMSVPLLRRHGLSMTQATAMANPLSLPVAVMGSLTYVLMAPATGLTLGPHYLGYVNVPAFVLLTLGALLGIRAATPWVGRLNDRVHALIYVGLLLLVMSAMALPA